MKSLIVFFIFSFSALASTVDNYTSKIVGDHAFLIPKNLEVEIFQINAPSRDACIFGKFILKDHASDFAKYNCNQNNDSEAFCKVLAEGVEKFATLDYDNSSYGSAVTRFSLTVENLDHDIPAIAKELSLPISAIKIIYPKIPTQPWMLVEKNHSSFFAQIKKVFSLKNNFQFKAKQLHVLDRITQCQLAEGSLSIAATQFTQESVTINKPKEEVELLHNFYEEVKNEWELVDRETKWKNSIHPLFTIGAILKNNLKKSSASKIYSLEEMYDKLFQHYIVNDEFSVYIKRFASLRDFEQQVHPGDVSILQANTLFFIK